MQVEKLQKSRAIHWVFMMLATRLMMAPQFTTREEDLMLCTRDQMKCGIVLKLLDGLVVTSKPLHFPTLVRSGNIGMITAG